MFDDLAFSAELSQREWEGGRVGQGLTVMSWRVGARGNYPYHSLGWLASLRGCEVLLVVVQVSAGYCVLYGCPSRCSTCGCRSAKAARKCEGVRNG